MEEMKTGKVTARTATRWGLTVAVLTLPVAVIVGYFVNRATGMAAWVALMMMIGAVRAFWHLRRHTWFWMSVAALTIIHVVLIIVVPWPTKSFPAPELWPVGIVDFLAICGFIKLVEKAMTGGNGVSSAK